MSRPPARIFITGAQGFIGRALAERYRSLGMDVRGMDLDPNPGAGIVAGDIASPGVWQAHAAGCDLFLHAAAVVSNTGTGAEYRRITVAGTRHAIDAAVAGGCGRFVHLSSIAAYGVEFPDGVNERHPVTVLSGLPYCDAKAASEQVALAAHAAGELAVTIVRPGDVYGPGSRPWVLLPLQMMRKRSFMLPAGGHGTFSPVFIDNLVDGIVLAAAADAATGQIFNLTDGRGVSCGEFFGNHWRWLGRRGGPPCVPTAVALPLAEMLRNVCRVAGIRTEMSAASVRMLARTGTYSIDKARDLLGYTPQVGLQEGLDRTRRWLIGQDLVPAGVQRRQVGGY